MRLIDLTVPVPPAWPPPRTGSEFELLVHYLRRRDPVGYRVHLTLAFAALFLAPLWHAPSAIAFGILILILLFKPAGLLGRATIEKV